MKESFTKLFSGKYRKYVVGLGIPAVLALVWRVVWPLLIYNSPPEVSLIQCEGQLNPVEVQNLTPKLSWIMHDSDHNSSQQKAAVQVGSAPDAADIWDFEYMSDKDNVVYNIDGRGRDLEYGTRYYWKVRVWDNKGKPSISWNRGYFQLIEKKSQKPKNVPKQKEYFKPKDVNVPDVADVKFTSKLSPLLDESTIQTVQEDIKKAAVKALRKHGEKLQSLEIMFKEKFDRSAERLEKGKSYTFEMAVFIVTKSDKRIVTEWYGEKSSSPIEIALELKRKLCGNLGDEIKNWL